MQMQSPRISNFLAGYFFSPSEVQSPHPCLLKFSRQDTIYIFLITCMIITNLTSLLGSDTMKHSEALEILVL
jgi:hypothetical protein